MLLKTMRLLMVTKELCIHGKVQVWELSKHLFGPYLDLLNITLVAVLLLQLGTIFV